jgi:ferredoxin
MRVQVDKELCIGCESCVDLCPEVFDMEEEVAYTKIDDDIPEDTEDTCREAAEACPTEAIIVEE